MFKGWDSLDRLYGRCLNQFGTKRTSQLSYGSQDAYAALFCQWKVILSYGMFEGSKGRVFGSRGCDKVVSKILHKLVFTDVQVLVFWTNFLVMKQSV